MRLLTLAVAAILTATMSGCIAGDGTITAKEGLGPARDAADALADGIPQLVGVFSLEPFAHFEQDDFEANVYLDPTPGDGLAPGWTYLFAVGSDLVAIGYAPGLGVIFDATERDVVAPDEEIPVIRNWTIDSDDAARALAASDDWPEMTDSMVVIWDLAQDDECPVWSVEAFDMNDDMDSHYAMVDGCTGQVIETTHDVVVELGSPDGMICNEINDGQMAITPMEPYVRMFEMEQGGALEWQYSVPQNVNGFELAVYDPEGRRVVGGGGGGPVPSTQMGAGSLWGTEPGIYRVEATSDEGVTLNFEVTYNQCRQP